jgi:hypothetical protein
MQNLRCEGNSETHLLANGIVLQSGNYLGCQGSDCGSFYNSVENTDIRYATNGVLITGKSLSLGSNGNVMHNVRVGDSVNEFRITAGDGNRCTACAVEGATGEAIWVEEDNQANNNNNQFTDLRIENPTSLHDIRVDPLSYGNKFTMGMVSYPAKILDNGVATVFDMTNVFKRDWGNYTSMNALLNINPYTGVRFTNPPSAGRIVFGAANPLPSNNTGGSNSYVQIHSPNTNFGFPLALICDGVGRGLGVISQGYDQSTSTGTSMVLHCDGSITATQNATNLALPISFPNGGITLLAGNAGAPPIKIGASNTGWFSVGENDLSASESGTRMFAIQNIGPQQRGTFVLDDNGFSCVGLNGNACLTHIATGVAGIGTNSPKAVDGTLFANGNKRVLRGDWGCGTAGGGIGGVAPSCTSATIVGVNGPNELSFDLPQIANSYQMDCDLFVSQAVTTTANTWAIITAPAAVENVAASYTMGTTGNTFSSGATVNAAPTTNPIPITPNWTLGVIDVVEPVHIHAAIEGVPSAGTTLSLALIAPSPSDTVRIYRGSACHLY